MRLNKLEKIIIVVILLGLVIIGGGFMFVLPSYENIGKNSKTLASNLQEKVELEEKLARLDTIDADIETQKKDAIKYEGGFYPDLTSYEASEIAMAYLKNSGLEAHTIAISPISTKDVKLEYYLPSEVEYDLKTYSAAVKSDNGEDTIASGEFLDGNKKYSISVSSILDITISDDNGNVVAPAKYSDTMKKVYKAALCDLANTEDTAQTVAATLVTYEVTGKSKDYIDFIDHIYSLERATSFESVTIPMTTTINEDENSTTMFVNENGSVSQGSEANGQEVIVTDSTEITQELSLILFSVEPMNPVKSIDADGTTIVLDQRPTVY